MRKKNKKQHFHEYIIITLLNCITGKNNYNFYSSNINQTFIYPLTSHLLIFKMLETAELEGSQGQNPQSCSGHPQVADSGNPLWGCQILGEGESVTIDLGVGEGGVSEGLWLSIYKMIYLPANLTCTLLSALNNCIYWLQFGAKSLTAHDLSIICWS